MSDSLQAQITQLQQSLHDLALKLADARANHPGDVPGLQAQFAATKAQVDALVAQEQIAETPSETTQAIGSIFDTVGSVIQSTVQATKDAVSGIGTAGKLLPIAVIAVLAIGGYFLYRKYR